MELGRIDAGLLQKTLQQEVSARAGLPVDEAHARLGEVVDAINFEGVALGDHEALAACGHVDDLAFLGVQPLGVMLKSQVFKLTQRNVKTGQRTVALIKRGGGLLAAHITPFHVVALLDQELDQFFDCKAMAGMHLQDVFFGGHDFGELGFQL